MSKANYLSGFTLVEVVMIVAIISLISVTIGVSLSSFSPRELESEVQKLVGDLAWAKSMAISTHHHYRVEFDIDSNATIDVADNNTYLIYKVDPDGIEADLVVKRRALSLDDVGGINLTNGTDPILPILNFSFMNPQGNLDPVIADPVTIELQRSNNRVGITIRNLTGHISWERL